MYEKIAALSSLCLLLLFAGCTSSINPPKATNASNIGLKEVSGLSETACKQMGFDWVQVPGICGPLVSGRDLGCGYRCDIKTSDGGKKCQSSADCQGVCRCGVEKDADGYLLGTCSQYKHYTEISDCACILYNKTKTTPSYACA